MMNQLFGSSYLFGGNAPFVEELYENYLDNPTSVSGEWRDYFDRLAQLPGAVARDVPHLPVVHAFAEQAKSGGYRAAAAQPVDEKKQVSVLQMISAYRTLGRAGPISIRSSGSRGRCFMNWSRPSTGLATLISIRHSMRVRSRVYPNMPRSARYLMPSRKRIAARSVSNTCT